MPQANLRQLSRQYARGAIHRAEYRRSRAALIESILNLSQADSQSTGPNTDVADDERNHTDVPPPRADDS